LEVDPTGFLRHQEDVLGAVFVRILGVRAGVGPLSGEQLGAVFLKAVRDVLEEDEAEQNVLVLGRADVAAQLVRRGPELDFKADAGSRIGGGCRGHGLLGTGHGAYEGAKRAGWIPVRLQGTGKSPRGHAGGRTWRCPRTLPGS
jgi:hypothetical protein